MGMTSVCPDDLVRFAESLADASRPILRKYFRARIDVETKADTSPVTRADRETEAELRCLIAAAHPGHGILGEEYGAERTGADYVWVLDPLDGTKAFITGKPLFGTLIALVHQGTPILGVIDAAATGERWVGAAGRSSTLDGKRIVSRKGVGLEAALLNATSPDMFKGAQSEAFARLQRRVKGTYFGGDCYAYGLVAAGFIDLVGEASMKPYDYLALVPIIAGAGGIVTDWSGLPLGLTGDGTVLAAGDLALHEAARQVLAA